MTLACSPPTGRTWRRWWMAQANGIQALLVTPTLIEEDPGSEGNQRLAWYAEAMRSLAREKNCRLADAHALFLEALPHKPAGTEYWLTTDGVHPSSLGNAILAAGILRALGIPDKDLAHI